MEFWLAPEKFQKTPNLYKGISYPLFHFDSGRVKEDFMMDAGIYVHQEIIEGDVWQVNLALEVVLNEPTTLTNISFQFPYAVEREPTAIERALALKGKIEISGQHWLGLQGFNDIQPQNNGPGRYEFSELAGHKVFIIYPLRGWEEFVDLPDSKIAGLVELDLRGLPDKNLNPRARRRSALHRAKNYPWVSFGLQIESCILGQEQAFRKNIASWSGKVIYKEQQPEVLTFPKRSLFEDRNFSICRILKELFENVIGNTI